MADPKVYISRRQNYSCIMCGKCCRRFYVALRESEIRRLDALDWGRESGVPDDFVKKIHGDAKVTEVIQGEVDTFNSHVCSHVSYPRVRANLSFSPFAISPPLSSVMHERTIEHLCSFTV